MTTVKIAFVLDCTASMDPWIHAAKTKIGTIVDTVKDDYPEALVQVGLVAYRDYGDLVRSRVVDFSTAKRVMEVLAKIRADGGDDEAEDVAGALSQTLSLSWNTADIRMVFHIADAPAHGRLFHGLTVSDRFPRGDPDGLDPRDSILQMSRDGFYYTFVRITSATDTMLEVFHTVWMGSGVFRVLDLTPQQFGSGISRAVSQAIDHYTSSQGM